ncbi:MULTISPECIES: ferredoxin [unclassified Legionella]|uniref:(2Fe-2S) ferredoxin domain-containing protein n=1 Tax=unclassified Legionella TaxID=2622702 RepID=UPI0010568997|nr:MULTISPECIES: (2Fe-2S) ferredoxin domain-containing protein [unclassified Legionella]MDI9818433.1 (2Fe-2S) ferredoxin domain-containing protein [Legionella sp. PL877]
MNHYAKHVFLCTNQKVAGKQCCALTGGEPFFSYMKMKLLELDLHGPGKIRVSKSGCLGRCSVGPCMVIYPEGVWYSYATQDDIDEIIECHLMTGGRVERLLIPD